MYIMECIYSCFFYICSSSKHFEPVIEKQKTFDEKFLERETEKFIDFAKHPDKNTNVDDFFYDKDKYDSIMREIDNNVEPLWKRRILCHFCEKGPVFMYYDPYKMGFTYSSRENVTYPMLCGIAMKYVRTFFCYDFFMDNHKMYFEREIQNSEKQEENTIKKNTDENQEEKIPYSEETLLPNKLYICHFVEKKKEKTKEQTSKAITKGPFAKLKKYQPNEEKKTEKKNDVKDKNKGDDNDKIELTKPKIPIIKNKVIYIGNTYNFEVLQKQKIKKNFNSNVMESMKGFSYADFKKKMANKTREENTKI